MIKRLALALVAIFSLCSIAYGQDIRSTLNAERTKYPALMTRAQIGEMLNAVVYIHRDEGYGLLRKDGGNNCPTPAGAKVSCDWIVNTRTQRGGDVLGSATNDDGSPAPATPGFNQNDTFTDFSLFVAPAAPPSGPGPIEPPPPPPPAASNAATVELQQQQLATLTQLVLLQQQQLAALAEQNAAIARGLADIKTAIAAGVKIRF